MSDNNKFEQLIELFIAEDEQGAKVTGNLEVTGAQIDFTALPTSDPGVAGRLWRSGNDVKISTG